MVIYHILYVYMIVYLQFFNVNVNFYLISKSFILKQLLFILAIWLHKIDDDPCDWWRTT